jgi:hypothetical protein
VLFAYRGGSGQARAELRSERGDEGGGQRIAQRVR